MIRKVFMSHGIFTDTEGLSEPLQGDSFTIYLNLEFFLIHTCSTYSPSHKNRFSSGTHP